MLIQDTTLGRNVVHLHNMPLYLEMRIRRSQKNFPPPSSKLVVAKAARPLTKVADVAATQATADVTPDNNMTPAQDAGPISQIQTPLLSELLTGTDLDRGEA